jgi:hypothetical protein
MMGLMERAGDVIARQLTAHEQRALSSFLAGRLPAGQLEAELARARAITAPVPAAITVPAAPLSALRAA